MKLIGFWMEISLEFLLCLHVFKRFAEKYLVYQTHLVFLCSFIRQPLFEEIQQHEPVLSAIKKSADKFLQSAEPGKERDRVEQKLTRIQSRWEEVQKNASDRKSLLEEIEPVAQQYRESLQDIISWLNAAEKNMVLLKYVPCDTKGPQKYEELLKEMESSLEKQQSSLSELDHFTRSLMEFQPVDANFVSSQVQDVKNRFAALDSGLKEKASNLEKIKQLLEDFTERVHALEELVVQGKLFSAWSGFSTWA